MSTILITGAAGSLGSILTQLYVNRGDTVRAYDINEAGLADLKEKHDSIRVIYGDITDREHLEFAMRGVDTVIHTAAMKNISITEKNPEQTIKTNVQGTLNVAMAAIAQGVKKAIFISSDKAVDSVLIYGDTKALGEKIWRWAHMIGGDTKFSTIRPCNFWKSRGNVFETWARQEAHKENITLTHKNMQRYFIKTDKVAKFVLDVEQALSGGEIFIPNMKSYCMYGLAKEYADRAGTRVEITGIREGEKLKEALWSKNESHRAESVGRWWADYDSGWWVIK